MITLTFASWIIPLGLTILYFVIAVMISGNGFLDGLFEFTTAIIASLITWLVWALMK